MKYQDTTDVDEQVSMIVTAALNDDWELVANLFKEYRDPVEIIAVMSYSLAHQLDEIIDFYKEVKVLDSNYDVTVQHLTSFMSPLSVVLKTLVFILACENDEELEEQIDVAGGMICNAFVAVLKLPRQMAGMSDTAILDDWSKFRVDLANKEQEDE